MGGGTARWASTGLGAALAAAMLAPAAVQAAAAGATGPAMAARAAASARPAGGGQCAHGSARLLRSESWAQQQLHPASAWPLSTGTGQLVAVLDSGVSAQVPALAGAVLPGRSEVGSGSADSDCLGHGTFVAGLIAARPTQDAPFTGLAPGARILPVDVVTPDSAAAAGEVVTAQAVAAGIRYAVAQGATVIDVSTVLTPGAPALRAAVDEALARNVVVIAPVSAGGSTGQADQTSYPAAYPGVLAVVASTASGAAMTAGRPGVRVDLAAPGDQVRSTGPGSGGLVGSGASVATGFVAGAAALVRSYYPELTAAQVISRLELTAEQPGTKLPDPQVGYGIVDPYTAVTTLLPSGSRPAAARPRLPRLPQRPATDRWPVTAALLVSVVMLAAVGVGAGVARIVHHGRRRAWRPPHGTGSAATRTAPPSKSGSGHR